MAKKRTIKPSTNNKSALTVVGVGASAGGLEALQSFFKNLSDNTGLAYVVVQHLSPDYKSMMDELLARHTNMAIHIIEEGISLKPDSIYLIPPRKNLRIFEDKLFLTKQDNQKTLNLPIDIFFRSLAEEKGKDAIGIILSGTGSDGTMGTRAIKEKHGIVMVQDENSAKFNGMPSSAISTGLVDFILPPENMGKELENYLKHPLVRQNSRNQDVYLKELDSLSKVVLLLRDYSGIDFSYYKENTIHRRLERRISINRFRNLEDYIEFLEDSDKEKEILYREFLIGVTQFFRDKDAFNSLRSKVLPKLFTKEKRLIRVWTSGCSTGEEAYSIAISMLETAEEHKFKGEIKIFASDIDKKSIEVAGRGFYPDSIIADIDPVLLGKYFFRKEDGYHISEQVRNCIVFATHNVLKDPPFSKLDLVICRNLFIYLKPDIQLKLLSRFYYSLNSEGYLFMGSSETLGGMAEAFDPVDLKNKIYKYRKGYNPPITESLAMELSKPALPQQNNSGKRKKDNQGNELINDIISEFLPPSIIIDSNYFVKSVINNINPFTEIQSGSYSNELFSLLSHDLGLFVNNILRQLRNNSKTKISRTISGLKSLENKTIKIEGRNILREDQTYYILSFEFIEDSKDSVKKQNDNISLSEEQGERVVELEKELKTAKENLAATVEELESANEELQSSNEELIASNEELQSTNEELQSVNEELYTVNSEHQQKIEELTRLNNDINNLLKNTEIAAIYLDSNLSIRKITPHVSKVTNVMEYDIGRPIKHISVIDSYPELSDDASRVIEALKPVDKEITGKDKKPFFVRIRPYRTMNNAVDGVLITFVDITELKKLQSKYVNAYNRLSDSLKLGNMAWWEWDVNTGNVFYNDRKATMLGYTPEEFPNDVYEICNLIHPDDYEKTMDEMSKVLKGEKLAWDVKYRMKCKDGSYIWYQDNGSIKDKDKNGKVTKMIGMVINVTESKEIESELKISNNLLSLIVNNTPTGITMVSADGWLTFANNEAMKIFNISHAQILNRNYDSGEWEITDLEGEKIDNSELPFSIISKQKKPIKEFKHYIKVNKRKNKVLLEIDGAPILSKVGNFEGAVFSIRRIKE